MILLMVLILVVGLLSAGFVTTQINLLRYSSVPWRKLIEGLDNVDMSGINEVAREYLRPQETHQARSEDEKLSLVGGTKGLASMRHNADVMIAIAGRAKGWDPKGASQIGELMLRDANKIKSAAVGVGLSRTIGYGNRRVGSYVTEACAAYSLMLQRVISLYEQGDQAHLNELAAMTHRRVELKGAETWGE